MATFVACRPRGGVAAEAAAASGRPARRRWLVGRTYLLIRILRIQPTRQLGVEGKSLPVKLL